MTINEITKLNKNLLKQLKSAEKYQQQIDTLISPEVLKLIENTSSSEITKFIENNKSLISPLFNDNNLLTSLRTTGNMIGLEKEIEAIQKYKQQINNPIYQELSKFMSNTPSSPILEFIENQKLLIKPISESYLFVNNLMDPYIETIKSYGTGLNDLLTKELSKILDTSEYFVSSNLFSNSKKELFNSLINNEEISKELIEELENDTNNIYEIINFANEENIGNFEDSLGIKFSDETIEGLITQPEIRINYSSLFQSLNKLKDKKMQSNLKNAILFIIIVTAILNPDSEYSKNILKYLGALSLYITLATSDKISSK